MFGIRGTHTVFSISFHDVNQMPVSPRTNFLCETIRSACSSGSKFDNVLTYYVTSC